MRITAVLLLGFLSGLSGSSFGFDQERFNSALQLISKDNLHLPGVAMMEQMVAEGAMHAAMLAQFMAITGDLDRVESLVGTAGTGPSLEAPALDVCEYSAESAISAIVEATRDYKVVMLNEAHHVQEHRAFALQLALALKEAGFTHFGAEAFSPGVLESVRDGFPSGESGIYTADPFFADLLRQTVRVGYSVFSYEQDEHQQAPGGAEVSLRTAVREQSQAGNIKRIIDSSDDEARFFVYAGYSHINQVPSAKGTIWMALRLKYLTGLDILSIDQVAGTPRLSDYKASTWYEAVSACHEYDDSFVLRGESGEFLSPPGTNIAVFHPRPRESRRLLLMSGYRHERSIKVEALDERTLVRAFSAGEPKHAIPMSISSPPSV